MSKSKNHKETEKLDSISAEEPKDVSPVIEDGTMEVDRIIRSLEKIETPAKTSVGDEQKVPEQEASHPIAEVVPSENRSIR